jgi:hypothetical protein
MKILGNKAFIAANSLLHYVSSNEQVDKSVYLVEYYPKQTDLSTMVV